MAEDAAAEPDPNWLWAAVSDEPEKVSFLSVLTSNSERKKSPFRPS